MGFYVNDPVATMIPSNQLQTPNNFNGQVWVMASGSPGVFTGVPASGVGENWCQISPAGGLASNVFPFPPTTLSSFFYWNSYAGAPNLFTSYNVLTTKISDQSVLTLVQLLTEQDNTLSLVTNDGILLDNSGKYGFSFSPGQWYFAQLNTKVTIDPHLFIILQATLAIGGIQVAAGSATTSISSVIVSPSFSQVSFNGAGLLSLSDFFVEDQVSINQYPNAGNPVVRAEQLVIELGALPPGANVRATQLLSELAFLQTPNVRCTQLVIELMTPNTGSPGTGAGGWKVREA